MKRTVSILLLTIFFLSFGAAPAAAAPDRQSLRIGLAYGGNAKPSANLANEVGEGYAFGYFEADYSFVPLAQTSYGKITVLKNKLMYIGSDKKYYDTAPSSVSAVIGPYRVQPAASFSSAKEAQKYASSLAAQSFLAFPAYIDGVYVVRIGNYTTEDEARAASSSLSDALGGLSCKVIAPSKSAYTVAVTGTENVIFEYDTGTTFAIQPLSDEGDAKTWFSGYNYYGAFEYNRVNGNDITVVNIVELEDYVKGVIPYEMSASWPIEALKAQALCARSYALRNLNKHASAGFDLCNTTDCQVYRGTSHASANSDAAVDETAGLYVTYNGQICQTFYHAASGGATENSENVWNEAIPYLRAVEDQFEDNITFTGKTWSYTISPLTVTKILQSKNYSVSSIVDVYVDAYTDAGNVYGLSFVDASGKVQRVTKEAARTILNSSAYGTYVHSQRFTISADAELYYLNSQLPASLQQSYAIGADGKIERVLLRPAQVSLLSASGISKIEVDNDNFHINGRGSGHNVGMSQQGARGMALEGYDYRAIIKHYYTDVTIFSVD